MPTPCLIRNAAASIHQRDLELGCILDDAVGEGQACRWLGRCRGAAPGMLVQAREERDMNLPQLLMEHDTRPETLNCTLTLGVQLSVSQ